MDLSRGDYLIHFAAARRGIIAICRDPACRHRQNVDIARVTSHVGKYHPVLPTHGLVHYSERMRCPLCGARGMFVWPEEPKYEPASIPNYRILDHGREYPYRSFRELATADNLFVGKGAYAAAAHFYRDHMITLQQGAFVVDDSKKDGLPEVMTAEDFQRVREAEGSLSALRPKG